MKRRLLGVATAVLGTVLIGGVSVPHVAAAPVATTVTLPIFGATLTTTITTGPGGALTDVSVDNASAVATKLTPRKVVFEIPNPDAAGEPGRVVVKSKHGGQSVSARGGTLADVTGAGSWNGDVFGTGVASNVTFSIGGTDAAPDITPPVVTPAAGLTFVVSAVDHSTGDGDDDESGASARVSVTFKTALGDQSRTLKISVKVETNDDGDSSAKVSVSLGRIKGVAIDAVSASGPHTWTGLLCNGSTATINYTVGTDGSVSTVTTTPAADVKQEDGKLDVRFSDNERVRIKVREEDGLIKISVDEKIRCDSPNPTTNVSTSIPADNNGDDNGDNHDKHHGGGTGNDG